jgi:hypothetical protein
MDELAVSVALADGSFTTFRTYDSLFRSAIHTPEFLDGNVFAWDALQHPRPSNPALPLEGGYVLIDDRSKTITQWGMVPGVNEVVDTSLGVDLHGSQLKRTPAENKILGFVHQKLRGADYLGVRDVKRRELLRPYITEARYFPELLADMVTKEFEPLANDVALINKMQELGWEGKTRGWLIEDRPNIVTYGLNMPGWTLNTIQFEQIADLKELVGSFVEFEDEDHEAWQTVADERGYDIPTPAFKI